MAAHNKLHPIFSGEYLSSLRELPCDNPLSDWRLRVGVWLEIDPNTGDVTRLGVSQPSGSREFDAAALEAFLLAFPVEVPAAIGREADHVYINWELHRRPDWACSTYFAHPMVAPGQKGHVPKRAL